MFSRLRHWRVPEWLVYATLALTGGAFCFLWIERAPLFEWDEARHAVNAWEMREHGDPFNYTFTGAPDRWNAKPQLLVWLIRAGYEVFGPRELAVRWASALAVFMLGFVVYRLHRLFFSRAWALFGAIVVFTMRGLVGYHVGRTGDMDALLTLFLCASATFWLWAQRDSERERAWHGVKCVAAGLCFGLAFLSKGFAASLILPGFALHAWHSGRRRGGFPWRDAIRTGIAGALLPFAWIAAQMRFGVRHATAEFAGHDQISTMFFYDIVARIRGNVDGQQGEWDPGFLLRQLDVMASPWGYVLLALLGALLWNAQTRARILRNEALLCAASFLFPMALAIALTKHKLPWYVAPLLPFVALALVALLESVEQIRFRWAVILSLCASGLALARQGRYIARAFPADARTFFSTHEHVLRSAERIDVAVPLRQDEIAYLGWARPDATRGVSSAVNPEIAKKPLLLSCAEAAAGGTPQLCTITRAE